MALLKEFQQRTAEIGRIRIGAQILRNGKTVPTKLDSFRFTTNSRTVADAVAELYGGTVREWKDGRQSWEVYTEQTELGVMIPPGDAAVSQWWEMWSGGGCVRRCDGENEQLSSGPCVCPAMGELRSKAAAKGQACKPMTRVSVILPDLPGLGTWRLTSGGYNAAVELGSTADFLARAREAGAIIPARLRLEQRTSVSEGQTRKFAVAVLDVGATLRELATGGGPQSLAESLPPAPSNLTAIAASPRVPDDVDDDVVDAELVEDESDVPDLSASAVVAMAEAAGSVAALTEVARQAQQAGVFRESVETSPGVVETVEDVLLARKAELEQVRV